MRKMLIAALGLALAIGMAGLAAAAADQSVTGNLVDTYCYTVVGAHGASHAQCALKCAQKGIPVGLVEKGSSKMYILLPPKNGQALPASVLNNMEKQVTVTGKSYSKNGVEFLTVESVK